MDGPADQIVVRGPHVEGRLRLRAPEGATFLVDWSGSGDFEFGNRYLWPDGAVRRSGTRAGLSSIYEMDGNAWSLPTRYGYSVLMSMTNR